MRGSRNRRFILAEESPASAVIACSALRGRRARGAPVEKKKGGVE